MSELDQVVDARRAVARAAPKLCPRDQLTDDVHDLAQPSELAVPVLERQAVFRRLELAKDEGPAVNAHRLEERRRDRLHAMLNAHDAFRLVRPRWLWMGETRGERRRTRLLQVEQPVAVRRCRSAHERDVALETQARGPRHAARDSSTS